METAVSNLVKTESHAASQFNFGKLQAVICMAASAAVSIALIVWAVQSFL
jgi:hypothetical protein